MALLPANEVKICSRPKINFLHFTRRTPTNVFPHNNNQPGNCLFFVTNYSTEICQIYFLWIISDVIILNAWACFNALWNHHELELSSRWQADHICQMLWIMSEKHNARFSRIILKKIKSVCWIKSLWIRLVLHLASWLIFRLRCPPCLVGLVCVDSFK